MVVSQRAKRGAYLTGPLPSTSGFRSPRRCGILDWGRTGGICCCGGMGAKCDSHECANLLAGPAAKAEPMSCIAAYGRGTRASFRSPLPLRPPQFDLDRHSTSCCPRLSIPGLGSRYHRKVVCGTSCIAPWSSFLRDRNAVHAHCHEPTRREQSCRSDTGDFRLPEYVPLLCGGTGKCRIVLLRPASLGS